jgi:asparagine synthase (glutamine-hydrolysing)
MGGDTSMGHWVGSVNSGTQLTFIPISTEADMCGICGKLVFDKDAVVAPELLRAMLGEIRHRGPDDDGIYTAPQIGLGHRRLSIIDLNSGHQPLSNEDGSIWVVFNGEIYNYRELREYLRSKGHVFKTQTDTEVIVHLYEEFGLDFVEKLRGMFAIALWDENRRTLVLLRDRVGIKPIYYYLTDNCIVFGSEIKAVIADPAVKRELAVPMIDRFLTFFYMPGEETLFRNLNKLAPGSLLVVKEGKPSIRKYWDLSFRETPDSALGFDDAKQRLLELLEDTVKLHMISDVPVGFLLSGGVDSTAILSLAVGKTNQPLHSFTIGFSDASVADERPFARLAAKQFGTEHHEMTITSKDFSDFLPKYVWHMEEPVCEPPAVALYYLSQLAKNYVKVLLSGEGGDEAFAGYSNYRNLTWLERSKTCFGPLNGLIGRSLSTANHLLNSEKIRKYSPLMGLPLDEYYYGRTSNPFRFFNQEASQLYSPDFARVADKKLSTEAVRRYFRNGIPDTHLSKMLYIDTKTWLPDDLLLKADKITMANSIELRVPFLDHKFLEFAASLPENYKLRGFTTKHIAKEAFRERVPNEILTRKKAGFPVPYESWLRNDLRDWVSQILLDKKTEERGYFKKGSIEKLISMDSLSGGYSKEIFSLVALELWHRAFLD